jgi:hypothetical protein
MLRQFQATDNCEGGKRRACSARRSIQHRMAGKLRTLIERIRFPLTLQSLRDCLQS